MIPQGIQPAEFLHRHCYDLARETIVAQIAGQRERLAAAFADFIHHRVRTRLVLIDHRDRRPLARQNERPGAARAGSCGCDERDLVLHVHGSYSSTCCYLERYITWLIMASTPTVFCPSP